MRPSRINTKKRVSFHHRQLECKSRKSRDTCSNKQVWAWNTKWGREKANRVLPRECTGSCQENPLATALHMDITRWLIPKSDWWYLQWKIKKLIQSAKTRPEADCGSNHELLIAKFKLKLKKTEKSTRPFRHDLNQIPHDYTEEVRSRFKGFNLIDRMPGELWMKDSLKLEQFLAHVTLLI